MHPDPILVFDIGLTNCKAVLFGLDGTILGSAAVSYPTSMPGLGWVEQEPQDWWRAMETALAQVRCQSPQAVEQVSALSVTAHMHSLVCLGPQGDALGPSLVLGDLRAAKEAEELNAAAGMETIYQITGARMDASMPLAKIAWLRAHQPQRWAQTQTFLSCKDWLRFRLCGILLSEPVDACGSAMYDIRRGAWALDLARLAGVRPEQLPEVADPCTLAGRLMPEPARFLGLTAGIPVAVGAGDDVEILGNGLLEPGIAMEHLGTTGSILACCDRPIFDPQMALEAYPHIIPGLWVLGGSVSAAGSALAWVDQVLRVEERSSGFSVPRESERLVFIPHLRGERCPDWEPVARGSWLGLDAGHSAADLRRSAWEGVLFSLKGILERIEALAEEQRIVSVSARDDQMEQIARASIYAHPLGEVRTSEPTALGAMMVAAVGLGVYNNAAEAVSKTAGWARTFEPDAKMELLYYPLCQRYQRACRILRTF
jgi:xylulokinase